MPVSSIAFPDRREFLITAFGQELGTELYGISESVSVQGREAFFDELEIRLASVVRSVDTESRVHYKDKPVSVEMFIKDNFYMGLEKEVYPEIMPYLSEMNSGKYVEIVLTGGIGSAKTTLGLWTQAYQLYLLSLMKNPHSLFGLDRSSEIEIVFQNLTATLAETVDYARFKELISRSPYFRKHFPHDRYLKSELRFPNRIIVKPVSGSNLATIGQNVIGGLIDELNYMAVTDASKKSVDKGVYNQAVEVYNSIARRRKSRYLKQGKLPGVLCLVSSKKYPGQFTDVKIEEAKADPTIYVYDKRVWDIKPDSFSKKKFRVFIGDEFRKPRVLKEGEKVPEADEDKLVEVPEDFKVDFEKDIVNALREIAGISHLSKAPFFTNSVALFKAFDKRHISIFSRETVDFDRTQLEIIKSSIRDKDCPRWAHIDLALTGDSAGLAIGYVKGFKTTLRGVVKETMPIISIDGVLEIKPPMNGEIPFWRIRKILYILRDLGMQIRWVSFDSFQSADSMQLLRQRGFITGAVSVDTNTDPYDFTKGALYDGRLILPMNTVLQKEMKDLQIDLRKQRVDHLPNGSKDCSDAVASVVHGLTLRREPWSQFEVTIAEIPPSIMAAAKKQDSKRERGVTNSAGVPDDE